MSERKESDKTGAERGPDLNEMAEAVVGVSPGGRLWRHLRDLYIRPSAILDEARRGVEERYLSTLKMFFLVSGIFLAGLAFTDAPVAGLESLALNGLAQVEAYLAAQGVDPRDVDDALKQWQGYAAWPIIFLSSCVFIIALKLFRPSVGWWRHVLVYLIASNASTAFGIAILPVSLVGYDVFMLSWLASIAIFLATFVRLAPEAYGTDVAGRIVLCLILLAVTLPALIISSVLGFAVQTAVLAAFDVSILDLLAATAEAPA